MAKSIIAHPGNESTADSRVLRGRRLYRDHAEQIVWKRGTWFIPSENSCSYYAVRLGRVEVCECADFEHRGGKCKHIHAASIAHAKSSVCSCCGHRVLNRFLTEVEDWHELLTWFVGDLICADCVAGGYWC